MESLFIIDLNLQRCYDVSVKAGNHMNRQNVFWGDKRYYSLDYYLKMNYGEKLYKLSLNGGMTCPNRDGTLDTRGCIFCSQGGSGDFAADAHLPIQEQIEAAKALVSKNIPSLLTSLTFRHIQTPMRPVPI